MADVYGKALLDYYELGSTETLWLHNSYDNPEEMPVDVFFRGKNEISDLELKALQLCRGKVLDVGAGVGSHSLILQEIGKDVSALEISETACLIMKKRGVQTIICKDFFKLEDRYDTLLLMMNGIGICGSIARLEMMLQHFKKLINPGGQIIFDSSDIQYLYEDCAKPDKHYYGEISYCYEYKGIKGNWFHWLYIDYPTLEKITKESGWKSELIMQDENDQYLAKLTLSQ